MTDLKEKSKRNIQYSYEKLEGHKELPELKTWVNIITKNGSVTTADNYLRYMRQFLQSCNKPLEKVTAKDINSFLYGSEWNKKTMAMYKSGILSYLRRRLNREQYSSIEYDLETIKTDTKIIKPEDLPTREEVFNAIKREKIVRNQALISLLANTGLRRGEAQRLEVSDLTINKNGTIDINIQESKTISGVRRVWTDWSTPYLKRWLKLRESLPGTKLFCNYKTGEALTDGHLYRICYEAFFRLQPSSKAEEQATNSNDRRKIAYNTKKKKVFPHQLRHYAVTQRKKEGWGDIDIANYFGHKSTTMSGRYAHEDLESMKARLLGDYKPDEEKSVFEEIDSLKTQLEEQKKFNEAMKIFMLNNKDFRAYVEERTKLSS